MKIYHKIFLGISVCQPAFALPLPAFASAAFGMAEILFILIALTGLYFPFFSRWKFKGGWPLYIVLLCSLGFNVHFFNLSDFTQQYEVEEHEGMVWNEGDRKVDPHSISENQAYKLLKDQEKKSAQPFSKNRDYYFVDARSRGETELGTAKGFYKISWADLVEEHKADLENKTVVVTCWTGMRGSEVCSKLRALGINCKYLKGGLKAWTALGLPLELNGAKSDFGSIETFPNVSRYLSAKETSNLYHNNATIVDIRSPAQFTKGSVPHAINIPLNDLTTSELQYRIQSIPPSSRGIIVACFGLISCSEAPALGWEAYHVGIPYLGAYSGGKELLANYEHSSAPSIYDIYQDKFVKFLQGLAQEYSIAFILFTVSLILSILLWQMKTHSLNYFNLRKDRQEGLQNKSIGQYDPIIINREKRFHLKSTFLPVLYSFLPLILAALSTFIVTTTKLAFGNISLFDLQNWNQVANISLLSVGASLLFLINVGNTVKKYKTIFMVAAGCSSIFLFKNFSNLTLLVFIISMSLLIVVESLVYIVTTFKHYRHQRQYNLGYLPLDVAYQFIEPHTKAYKLSYLISQGFNIPAGYILTPKIFTSKANQVKLTTTVLKNLGAEFAVRSSALNEDTLNQTHAGLNLSIVPARDLIEDAKQVLASYGTTAENDIVLVQKLINPAFSGVLFSQHPQWGGTVLIEWGYGLAGKRMEGSENCEQIVLERSSGQPVYSTGAGSEFSITPLYQLIINLEKIYQTPLDIEWAIDREGVLWLLQVRHQTALDSLSQIEVERKNLLTPKFKNLKVCELSFVMDQCTPLSASLVCSLWEPGKAADMASRMALWNWNQSVSQQNSYIYLFGRIWNSDFLLMTQPNKLLWKIAKKNFSSQLEIIEKDAMSMLGKNEINLSVQWNNLSPSAWVQLWENTINQWQRMQTFSFYFEFMAETSTKELLESNPELESDLIGPNLYNLSYRSGNDYEISQPRHIENGNSLNNIPPFNQSVNQNLPKKLQEKLVFTQRLIYLREVYKYHSLTIYYLLRLGILDLQKRYGTDVLGLNYADIPLLFSGALVSTQSNPGLELPDSFNAVSLALFNRPEVNVSQRQGSDQLKGIFVSQPSNIIGKLVTVETNLTLEQMEILLANNPGCIIYSKVISPHIVQLAQKHRVKALCSQYGSMLSHSSILAREAKIPFIVGIILSQPGKIELLESGEVKLLKPS